MGKKIFYILFVANYYNIERCVCWSNDIIIDKITNRYILPWYHIKFWSLAHSSERSNSANQRGMFQNLVTMKCDESPIPTFLFFTCTTSFQKRSAVCVVAAFCVRIFESVADNRGFEELYLSGGKILSYLLTELERKYYQCLRWGDVSSNPSLNQFLHNIFQLNYF